MVNGICETAIISADGFPRFKLKSQRAIVIDGSRGIGKIVLETLAKKGVSVATCALGAESGQFGGVFGKCCGCSYYRSQFYSGCWNVEVC